MPDNQVNTTTDLRGGINSAIVWVIDGYVVLWDDRTTFGDIQSRQYDMNGVAVGDVTTVNTVTEGRQGNFSATQFLNGGYVAVWGTAPFASPSDLEVRARVYDVNGVALGPELSLTEDPNSTSVPLAVAGLSDGTFAVAWQTITGSTSQRYVGVFSATGAKLDSVALSSTIGPILLQALDGGGFIAVQSDGGASPQTSGRINTTYFGSFLEQSSPTLVNPTHFLSSNNMAVGWADDDGAVIAWGGTDSEIYMRQYKGATEVTPEVHVNTVTTGVQYSPNVVTLPSGYVVTWTTAANNGDMVGQRYNAAGAPVGPEFLINEDLAPRQFNVHGVAFDQDTIAFSWRAGTPSLSTNVYQTLINFVDGTSAGETLTGSAGRDFIYGYGGNDILNGGDGADTLEGGLGNDTLNGGAGDDMILGGPGSDNLDGGAGIDTLSYADAAAAVSLFLTSTIVPDGGGLDTIAGFENVIGSAFNDGIVGDTENNVLRGAAGDDTLAGLAGDDTLDGGDGDDHAYYGNAGAGVTVNLSIAGAQTIGGAEGLDTLVSIENVTGSNFNDILIGDAGSNQLDGSDGDDVLDGRGGDDFMRGGRGSDTVTYDSAGAAITVSLAVNGGQDTGGSGTDELMLIDNLVGSAFNDVLTGNVLANTLAGGGGNDVLDGGAGADTLDGGAGTDVLYGLDGDDVLNGGGGTSTAPDYLYGGAGDDTYFVASTLTSPLDLVFEGTLFAGSEAGVNDVDSIHSTSQFFWDYYSVGETLQIDNAIDGGAYLVGGKDVASKTITGSSGTDFISTYGHNARVDAGAGSDAISFSLYGLDESYRGSNTVVMKAASGADYVYDFRSGTDHIDLSAFNFGITGQQVLDQAVNVDKAGTADDYCYFYLTSAGGVDNFVVFMGLLSNQLQAGDFIT